MKYLILVLCLFLPACSTFPKEDSPDELIHTMGEYCQCIKSFTYDERRKKTVITCTECNERN